MNRSSVTTPFKVIHHKTINWDLGPKGTRHKASFVQLSNLDSIVVIVVEEKSTAVETQVRALNMVIMGNLYKTAYRRVADPKIALTEKGKAEAEECGKRIREMIEKDNVPNWKPLGDGNPNMNSVIASHGLTLLTVSNEVVCEEELRKFGLMDDMLIDQDW
ncbi:hypothetical protein FEM48_Zijuj11G0031200 [Ziziphus jujuba var. spinosa]|uniref:Uncharacterized protein n=1 Tax=Ziziphus jujuba var. spinosa TaxID=714518 RepID=A0A978UGG4_ZIZJJ|nr:hypothetical protein FEM48_Zijuj11G0031200 [Ziziphus jujuba var. spinosa]